MWIPYCAKDLFHWGKGFFAPDLYVDEPRHIEFKVDGKMVPKGEDLSKVTDMSYKFGKELDLVGGLWLPF